MSEYEETGMKNADKCTLPSGILHGFLCPVCISLYESEQEAMQCMKAHDELAIRDFIMSMGEKFPIEILVDRTLQGKVVEIATYKRSKIDKVGEYDESNKSRGNEEGNSKEDRGTTESN